MSLYHHFPNKEAILDGVAEAIAAAAVGLPPSEADWRDKVRFLFTGLHLLVQAHPRALPLISTGVIRTPSGRRWMEALMRALLEAGFTPAGSGRRLPHARRLHPRPGLRRPVGSRRPVPTPSSASWSATGPTTPTS